MQTKEISGKKGMARANHEPAGGVKEREHTDEFLDFRKRTDKQHYYFFKNKLFILGYSSFRFSEKLQRWYIAPYAHSQFT